MATTGETVQAGDRLTHLSRLVTTTGERERRPVEAPWTGERVGTVPECTPADVEAAVERARAAGEAWGARPAEERAAVLERFAGLVADNRASLLDLLGTEAGKARRDGVDELMGVVGEARYYAEHAPEMLTDEPRRGALGPLTETTVRHDPRGVVGIVAPWNYPFVLTAADAVPALAAGNAVVLKPDEHTPFIACKALELFREAGLPEDVLQVVTGDGATLGEPLVAGSDYVSFTGSREAGRAVASLAGQHLTDCSLELGGKNPMLVLEDADMGRAVRGAVRGAYANAGQLCVGIERIYVHESRYEEFLGRFVDATAGLELGARHGMDVDVGSLSSADQLERVRAHVEDAREKGATVETGGRARPDVGPYAFEPTVLTGVEPGMAPHREETFGPVAAVYPVADTAEAVAEANDTAYGLNAAVFTGDTDRGREVAARIEAGTVNVNDPWPAVMGSMDAPQGGIKESGIGVRHGEEGLLKYTDSRTVLVQRGGPVAVPGWVPGWLYERLSGAMLRVAGRL
jgi:succinate-semialdehyde dehydrogenase/glutarate-semialdehyde dehydrogenase